VTYRHRVSALLKTLAHCDVTDILLWVAFVYCVITTLFVHSSSFLATLFFGCALFRIHILGNLKEQLDKFQKENDQFRRGNAQLKASVDNMHQENINLQVANGKLSTSIGQLEEVRVALETFAASTGNDIQHLMASLGNSIQEQRTIQKNSQEIQSRTKLLALQQEKAMLMNLFFQIQNQNDEKGLSTEEFDTFLDMLPREGRERMHGKLDNFASNDLDGDNIISMKEFKRVIIESAEIICGARDDRYNLEMTEP